jgi:magnesium transporter
MARLIKKRARDKAGSPPGSLVHIGERKMEHTGVTLITYGTQQVTEHHWKSIDPALSCPAVSGVSWLNIDGLHDMGMLKKLGQHFSIHPLTMEDIANTGQRPKVEMFEEYLFIVIKMLWHDPEKELIEAEQVSLVVTPDHLISFQEMEKDVFNPVRERIRQGAGRLRTSGTGYLAYALVDAVVDHYYAILETVGDRIDALEEKLISTPEPSLVEEIHILKREMLYFRKQVLPMREMLNTLTRSKDTILTTATTVFFKDVQDHAMQVLETIDSFRDTLTGMLDLCLSMASNRMNETMKMLTLVATIFIPLCK